MDKCNKCGEASVVEDDENIVCTACGHIQDDGTSFQLDRNLERSGQACHSGSSFNPTFAQGNYRLRDRSPSHNVTITMWVNYLHQICDRMKISNREMHKEASEIFIRAFKMDQFRILHSESKRALCASSVYVTCRRYDWPILIVDLMGVTDMCDEVLLKRLNRELIHALKIEIESPSLEEYVPTCLAEYGVTDKALVEKTVSVINLAVELWLQVGRRSVYLVLAACCIAWQASIPANHKKSVDAFRRTVLKKHSPPRIKVRHKELLRIVKTMFTKVPWVPAKIMSKKNAWMYYLDEIIKYKRTLISSVESPQGDNDSGDSVDSSILAHPAYQKVRRKRLLEGDRVADERDCKVSKSGHLTSESMNCPELSEKDIPDSELGLYIRTPEEVEMAKELQLIVDA